MTIKTFIRLTILLVVLSMGLLALSSGTDKPAGKQASECPSTKEKQDQNQASGDAMIWESVSHHLLSAVQ